MRSSVVDRDLGPAPAGDTADEGFEEAIPSPARYTQHGQPHLQLNTFTKIPIYMAQAKALTHCKACACSV